MFRPNTYRRQEQDSVDRIRKALEEARRWAPSEERSGMNKRWFDRSMRSFSNSDCYYHDYDWLCLMLHNHLRKNEFQQLTMIPWYHVHSSSVTSWPWTTWIYSAAEIGWRFLEDFFPRRRAASATVSETVYTTCLASRGQRETVAAWRRLGPAGLVQG